jgi:fumarate hydratase class II
LEFLIEGTKPNLKKIKEYVERSLMPVTALSPGHRLRQGA